ncbi:hypothetical protein A9Q86_00805 [Flavobacteriales bacterium 33_180_T64]|nr:hypothetical protein A9Q86_00805 [Flavobacteriales bacterium 33_180_T64]
MLKVLWLAPNFNHYKARFLNHLAKDSNVELTILSGAGRENMGDKELEKDWDFKHMKVNIPKANFGFSMLVRKALRREFSGFDWILIPAEKKNALLFIYALLLRVLYKKVKLFSYNHEHVKPKEGEVKRLDVFISKWFYRCFDKVIFYTEKSCSNAIKNKLINPKKAYWANNTIDTTEVEKWYDFEMPSKDVITLVFIGRLIKIKRVKVLIDFFNDLCNKSKENYRLEIIGDGPENSIVQEALLTNSKITWHGTLIDEEKIAPIMKKASLVFVPGLSGLSINHAFAYGRPYATLQADRHGPEISYLKDEYNGFILAGNFNRIEMFLKNRNEIEVFCQNAYNTSKHLNVNIWKQQILSALNEK